MADARFAVGDHVRTVVANPVGHTRLPTYLHGRRGAIESVRTAHPLPDETVRTARKGDPVPVYGVAFTMEGLWGPGCGARLRADRRALGALPRTRRPDRRGDPVSDHYGDDGDRDGHGDHDQDRARVALTARVRALEAALTAAGVTSEAQIDDVIDTYTERLGPRHGAAIVARSWVDPAFREQLLTDATGLVRAHGFDMVGGTHRELPFLELRAVENAHGVHNVIVCTLCSCYPLAILGPQPRWYKSEEYRARVVVEPRAVLAEFGLEVPRDTTIRVWDSTAETRYLVIPERPSGTEGMDVDELAALVTRDSMVGVATLPDVGHHQEDEP